MQVKVSHFKCGEFATTQTGINSRQINDLPTPSDSQEALHFVVGEGPAGPYLCAVPLHLLNVLERITGNTLVLFHPVHER